jgi:DNA-binding HxlR family transcriptional regulator
MDVPEGSPGCVARAILDRIGGRWAVHLLVALYPGTARYTELLNRVEGISRRMLTRTLRELERDGLVTRTEHPTVPATVDYALTPLALELAGPLRAIADWAERNGERVRAAQQRYDAAHQRGAIRATLGRRPNPD